MNTRNAARLIAVGGGLLALAACTDVSSSDVTTSAMYADINATATGDGQSTVRAVLRVGGALSTTFVNLTVDDALTATFDGETQTLSGQDLGAIHTFSTTFASDTAGEPFTVALERASETSAPATLITLPPAFDLDTSTMPTEVSRADDSLTLTWTPSGEADDVTVAIDGDCILFFAADVQGDPGTYTVAPGSFEAVGDTGASCELTYTVRRSRLGDVDSAYGEGGLALGIQEREGTILSTP